VRPFHSPLLFLLASLLGATAASGSPLLGAFQRPSGDEAPLALLAAAGSTDLFPMTGLVALPGLPLPIASDLDSISVFRALLRGRDLRDERSVLGDLIAVLPRLRAECVLEIRELRGDSRDPSEPIAALKGPRVGMR
jgi:hypothetical protein